MLEYTIEKALFEYDEAGAALIKDYIAQGIDVFNPNAFIIYQAIHIKFVNEKPGKIRFRKIPYLLGTHFSTWTPEYKDLIKAFEKSAKEQKCEISDLEISEFPDIKW